MSKLSVVLGVGDDSEERAIARAVRKHRKEICRYLNPLELYPILWSEGLLDYKKRRLVQGAATTPYETEASSILESLSRRDPATFPYSRFLHCIREETEHLGHHYVAALLSGESLIDEEEQRASTEISDRITHNLPVVLESLNLEAILPLMRCHGLVTRDELNTLHTNCKQRTEKERKLDLLGWLDTKGPLAYIRFSHCLREEKHHPAHAEISSLLLDSTTCTDLAVTEVSRRSPSCKLLQGPLKGKKYSDMMVLFQTCHHNGEWQKLEDEAAKYTQSVTIEFQVVALLESAISWIFRREKQKTLTFIDRAKKVCLKISNENRDILEARCEYILSRLYRYFKEYDEAREHARNAKVLLFNVDHGEDTSFANYCDACVAVECLPEHPSDVELRDVEKTFQYAIDDAHSHSNGLDLVAPHSFMRLAQMHLGSTHYSPGEAQNTESIRKAQNYLDAVKTSSLAQRSRCHFHLMKSDFYRNISDKSKARDSASHALELAQKYNFKLEVHSAESRLQSLSE